MLFGFVGGIGNGMTYMMPLVTGWEYFPNNKGLVTGIVESSYGFGSFTFNLLTRHIVNPENKEATIIINKDLRYFDWEVAQRVPGML